MTHPSCPYCGEAPHKGVCPRISAIEYESGGLFADPGSRIIKRVEFHPPHQAYLEVGWADESTSETVSGTAEEVLKYKKRRMQ